MSDSLDTIDGNEFDATQYAAFREVIPCYYSALGGYRKGWEARTTGKPMPEYPWDMPKAFTDTLPEHWRQSWEDYNRGYEAACERIIRVEQEMSNLSIAIYV